MGDLHSVTVKRVISSERVSVAAQFKAAATYLLTYPMVQSPS